MKRGYHHFGAQCLPLNRNRIVCLRCGKVVGIGTRLTGRRAKCSKTRRYEYFGDGGCGSRSIANGNFILRSRGHAEYRPVLEGGAA